MTRGDELANQRDTDRSRPSRNEYVHDVLLVRPDADRGAQRLADDEQRRR